MGTAREGYSKAVVETRLQAVNKLDETLRSAIRTNDPDLVQVSTLKFKAFLDHIKGNTQ